MKSIIMPWAVWSEKKYIQAMKNVGIYRCIVGEWEAKAPNFIFVKFSFFKEILPSLYNTFWKALLSY